MALGPKPYTPGKYSPHQSPHGAMHPCGLLVRYRQEGLIRTGASSKVDWARMSTMEIGRAITAGLLALLAISISAGLLVLLAVFAPKIRQVYLSARNQNACGNRKDTIKKGARLTEGVHGGRNRAHTKAAMAYDAQGGSPPDVTS